MLIKQHTSIFSRKPRGDNEGASSAFKLLLVGGVLGLLVITVMGGAFLGVKHPHRLKFFKNLAQVYVSEMILRGDFSAIKASNELPHFNLGIGFKHLQRLEALRQSVLASGKTIGGPKDKWFPSNIGATDDKVKVKVRLKGDSLHHYEAPRYSLSVKTKGDGLFEGMRRFSIQNRELSGRSISSVIFSEHAQTIGLLVPKLFLCATAEMVKN